MVENFALPFAILKSFTQDEFCEPSLIAFITMGNIFLTTCALIGG